MECNNCSQNLTIKNVEKNEKQECRSCNLGVFSDGCDCSYNKIIVQEYWCNNCNIQSNVCNSCCITLPEIKSTKKSQTNIKTLSLDTIVSFGKYKNKKLSELINDENYTRWVIHHCKSISASLLNSIKFYYNEKIKDKNEPLSGYNLTSRIKSLMNNRLYETIIQDNIHNINVEFNENENIISNEFLQYIKDIHTIYPSGSGCFIDYLFRHILSNFLNITFSDNRAKSIYGQEISIYKINNLKLTFYEKYGDKYTYNELIEICNKIKLIENEYDKLYESHKKSQTDLWKQKYTEKQLNYYYQMGEIKKNKKWKTRWENEIKMHNELNQMTIFQSFEEFLNNNEYYDIYCEYSELVFNCRCYQRNTQDIGENFPISFINSYEKVTNKENQTINIIPEIFIVSLAHNISFGQYNEEKSKLQFQYIINNCFKDEYIQNIINILQIFDGKKYAINPTLGYYGIPSDCDLIIDDNLIDFKVSKMDNNKYEILQLLGYSSLIAVGDHMINKIHIIDLYKNKLKTIEISDWHINQRLGFLNYMEIKIPSDVNHKIPFIIKIP